MHNQYVHTRTPFPNHPHTNAYTHTHTRPWANQSIHLFNFLLTNLSIIYLPPHSLTYLSTSTLAILLKISTDLSIFLPIRLTIHAHSLSAKQHTNTPTTSQQECSSPSSINWTSRSMSMTQHLARSLSSLP